MSNPEAYTQEIKSINLEIKRSNTRLSTLREQRMQKQGFLYKYMVDHKLEKFEGITINSIKPREMNKRKPEVEKKKDAIELFRIEGINDPEAFYAKLKNTQKFMSRNDDEDSDNSDRNGDNSDHEEERRSSKKPKKKNNEKTYDPFLGF
jgi:hypothetical protein